MNEELFNCLRGRGWQIERYGDPAPGIPENIRQKYPAARRWFAWISGVRSAVSSDETAWLLCAGDYAGQAETAFRWNEWERLSLENAAGNSDWEAEIRHFWDVHLPIVMSVRDGNYAYYAVSTETGAVVYGCEPEFEECRTAAGSLEEFLQDIAEGIIQL